jgi:hypothetical protein
MTEKSDSQTKGQRLQSKIGDKRSVFATISVSGAILTENSLFGMINQFWFPYVFPTALCIRPLCGDYFLHCAVLNVQRVSAGNGGAAAEIGGAVDGWSFH